MNGHKHDKELRWCPCNTCINDPNTQAFKLKRAWEMEQGLRKIWGYSYYE